MVLFAPLKLILSGPGYFPFRIDVILTLSNQHKTVNVMAAGIFATQGVDFEDSRQGTQQTGCICHT